MHAVLLSLALSTGEPLILTEEKVSQYRRAAEAAASEIPGAVILETSLPEVPARIASSPVVIAVGRRALTAARAQTRTPIVFCMVLGVSKDDLSPSVTGIPLEPDPRALLSALHQVDPKIRRVGIVYNPKVSAMLIDSATRAAAELGLTLLPHPVTTPDEVQPVAARMADGIDALWLPPDPKLYGMDLISFLLGFSAERRLPLIAFLGNLTEAGALASVSPDYAEIGRRAGRLAKEIAARPERARVPVPPPVYAPGLLTLNLKTADALGIDVSSQAEHAASKVYR